MLNYIKLYFYKLIMYQLFLVINSYSLNKDYGVPYITIESLKMSN